MDSSTNSAKIKEIRNSLNKLEKKQELMEPLQIEQNRLEAELRRLLLNEPICVSCGKHKIRETMWIATEEDLDNYRDANEGYGGPELNQYYCGC